MSQTAGTTLWRRYRPVCVTYNCVITLASESDLIGIAVDQGGNVFFTANDMCCVMEISAASGYNDHTLALLLRTRHSLWRCGGREWERLCRL